MINEWAQNVAKALETNSLIDSEEIDYYRFGLELIIIVLLKTTGILVLSLLLGVLIESIVFIIFFSSLRVQAGGSHSQSPLKCFIITCLITFTAVYIGRLIPINYYRIIQIILIISSLLAVYIFAPKDTPNRRLDAEEKKTYRKRSLITAVIASVVIVGIGYLIPSWHYYGNIAALALAFEGVTLIPINIKSNFKEVF
ncbi:accessory gene regulator B family protein [Alkaliphilus pronyensis]|uniref:Accessory gene regulator B family protein n=1 Tax=Alkaliphilus pronyensis TaxID=1482732 RepID=A0A6I0EXY4_9FIRM|nr:accessory gene regulator B family protein [Alkaliphilus pronyensis]KAB3534131.1 accessory gene regulator B family protein [Alkaliphilus pronyensis]